MYMMSQMYSYLDSLFGLSRTGFLSLQHLIMRILVIYIFGIILMRLQRQFMAINTPFNYILNFTLGSVLASAITGEAPFLPILGMTLFIFTLNYLVALFSYISPRFERLIKGERDLLVKDGQIQWKGMRRNLITKEELMEAIHENFLHRDLAQVSRAYFENNGHISVIEKKG